MMCLLEHKREETLEVVMESLLVGKKPWKVERKVTLNLKKHLIKCLLVYGWAFSKVAEKMNKTASQSAFHSAL